MIRTKRFASGGWRTVESFWNAKGTAFFKALSGAQTKVRFGVGWFGFDRQKQTLNGRDFKKLVVGLGSLGYARMQVRVSQTTDVTTCTVEVSQGLRPKFRSSKRRLGCEYNENQYQR